MPHVHDDTTSYTHQYPNHIPTRSPQPLTLTIYFLSLVSDRQSLDFYQSPIAWQSTWSCHTSKTNRIRNIYADGVHSTPWNLMHKHNIKVQNSRGYASGFAWVKHNIKLVFHIHDTITIAPSLGLNTKFCGWSLDLSSLLNELHWCCAMMMHSFKRQHQLLK